MDNLTHSLVGLTLGRTRLGRASPLAVPGLVVAANLPDLDIVVRPFGGSAAYLEYHRGVTHALVGIVAQALLFTVLWWWLERRVAPDRAAPGPFAKGGPFAPIAVGLLTHPLLDFLNVYGIRPWLPFDGTWIYGDLVFVVDPWGWLGLGAIAALAGPRSRGGDVGWAVVAVAATSVLYGVGRDRVPVGLLVAWPAAVLAIAAARGLGAGARRPRVVLSVGALLLAGYLATLAGLRHRAASLALDDVRPRLHAGETVVDVSRSPSPGDPRSWTVIVETDRRVLWETVDLSAGTTSLREAPLGLDDPRVGRAAATRAGRAWRAFVRHPTARVREVNGVEVVELSDARYWFTDWCTVVVPSAASDRE